jgi:glutaredoxin-like protein NrdH
MRFSEVAGNKNNHKVTLYALSTCVWCKLIKQYLNDNSIAYKLADVDLLDEVDKATANKDIINKGGSITYPTTIVDEKLVQGYRLDYIKLLLET